MVKKILNRFQFFNYNILDSFKTKQRLTIIWAFWITTTRKNLKLVYVCVCVCVCKSVKFGRNMVADVVYVIASHLKSICQTFPFYAKSP